MYISFEVITDWSLRSSYDMQYILRIILMWFAMVSDIGGVILLHGRATAMIWSLLIKKQSYNNNSVSSWCTNAIKGW